MATRGKKRQPTPNPSSPASVPEGPLNAADGVHPESVSAAASSYRQWRPHLSLYEEKRILRFASEEDLEAAIDLLWTDELRTLPHDTPDGKSLVIPAEAVRYFVEAGLRFTEKKLPTCSERPPEEIKRLRRL